MTRAQRPVQTIFANLHPNVFRLTDPGYQVR
jgi:hypothetical protein